jgi:hypothetical protein
MDWLNTLIEEIQKYAKVGRYGQSYLTRNDIDYVYIVASFGELDDERFSFTSLMVRIIADKIIIEEDRNSDPLYEALVQAGIPREQIILAYAGETIPNTA